MKISASSRVLLFTLAFAASLVVVPAVAQAQVSGPYNPVKHGNELVFGFGGEFTSTDGTSGTFTYRVTDYSATGSAVTYVYTRDSDRLTRTESTFTNKNPDGTLTVQSAVSDYGAAAPFTSAVTLTRQGHGQFVGQGTYTTPAGVLGTVTTVRTKTNGVLVTSTTYNGGIYGISTEVQTESDHTEQTTVKTARVDANGQASTVVQTRRADLTKLGSFPVN